jgi:hypothetical protein
VVLKNGKVLVAGGRGANNTVLASAELYDPSTGSWTYADTLSVARYGHTTTLLLSGHVLVAGGCTVSDCSAHTAISELYDPASNTWSRTGSLSMARAGHTATLLANGEVLAVDGSDGIILNTCELYDPSKGTWRSAPGTAYPRNLHVATRLQSGKVMITGGSSNYSARIIAEIYDPTFNKWTASGTEVTPRFNHTSNLLTDGTVLLAGGYVLSGCGRSFCFRPTATAEIYNETTNKFTAAGSMNHARAYHTASLLHSGKLLASGGAAFSGLNNSSEIFTPLTLKFSATRLNFGAKQVGLTSAPQTVTVSNASFHSATFTGIASSGDFAETNNCPSTLNPGQSCTITVSFTPTATGSRNGAVTLTDNSPGNPQQSISLAGSGEPFAFSLSPTSLSFPTILPGISSSPMDVTLINDGAASVSISAIAISPGNGTFTQTNNCPGSLNPGQSCTLQVVFTPPDSVSFSATLSVTDSAKNTQTVSLSGTGLD